jgi:hypothetical protein
LLHEFFLHTDAQSRALKHARIKHSFSRMLARRSHPQGRLSIHGLSATPDGSSTIKIYRWLEGPTIGHLAEGGQKGVTLLV